MIDFPFRLTLRGETLNGHGRLLDPENDRDDLIAGFKAYLQRYPSLAKTYGIRSEAGGKFNNEDIRKAVKIIKIICLKLDDRING